MATPESILIADIGSVRTKVGLIDQVGDKYRVIGTSTTLTTTGAQGNEVLAGVRRAVEQIEVRANRRLLLDDGALNTPESANGHGVDAFVAVTSAPPPLRVAIVGLSREVSVAAAARAINGTYALVETTIALDQMGGRWLRVESNGTQSGDTSPSPAKLQDPSVLAAETLARVLPDVIVLVGGIDGGATNALYEIANLVAAIAAARDEDARPHIIFAGNREARAEISARLGAVSPLRVVDNVHPALDRENLPPLLRELEVLYEERRITHAPEFSSLAKWSSVPIMPAARAFEYAIRFLSRRLTQGVLGLDIGGTTTTLVSAHGEAFTRTVRSDLGLGRSVESLIAQAGLERLVGWTPGEDLNTEDAHTNWLNRSMHPTVIPVTKEDAYLCQALAREALTIAARGAGIDANGIDLVILSGGIFSRNAGQGGLALLVIDVLEPRAPLALAADSLGLMSACGALAMVNPAAAADVIAHDGFSPLATVVTATSFYREGTVEVRVKMKTPTAGEMNVEIEHGSLELIPVEAGQRATLEVRPAPGVNVAGSRTRGGPLKIEVQGGALGLIVDARGRPIAFPTALDKRRAKTQQWLWDVGG